MPGGAVAMRGRRWPQEKQASRVNRPEIASDGRADPAGPAAPP